jgi:methyl-accepting chemotaxis protein
VVAGEVRSLAQHTETRTKEIKVVLDELATELAPAHEALQLSTDLVESTVDGVRSVRDSLERIAGLATDSESSMSTVATAVNEMSNGISSVFGDLKTATVSSEAIGRDTQALVKRNFVVAELVNDCFVQFGRVELDTQFHRGLRKARELSESVRKVFERAIDSGRCSLDDVLQYQYHEIQGADIQGLSRLFDVSLVPPHGFDPPKYSTRYDGAVDMDMQRVMDHMKASEPWLLYATVTDLNLYMPIHHAEFCRDWTGNPDTDKAGSRLKRFFYDQWVTTEGTRVGLGAKSREVPNRASREQFIQAGCEMRERRDSKDQFRIGLQVRDANTIVLVAQVPIFVKGHRYGSVACGWVVTER